MPISIDHFAHYRGLAGSVDQYVGADGRPGPQWGSLCDYLRTLDNDGLNRTIASVTESIRDSDVTMVEASGTNQRQWRLSAMPTIIDSANWATIQAGMVDRTEILELILDDLLGPRRLLREGIVPAGVLWQNPIFKRAYVDLPAPGSSSGKVGKRLDLSAFEIFRNGNGHWTVIGDRTRAPSGLGYLLENRIATAGVLGRVMRSTQTHRLAGFFDSLSTHLSGISNGVDSPRVAILTPRSELYRQFEDAYLSRYLGIILAQGTDLAVRGDRLFLKTIGGLVPIDVLWRHVNDRHCDPLSLNPRSIDGVPGLLRTIRHRRVSVANSIGSGLVQTPALFPYIDAAARFLVGRPPLLPSNPTWWCGDPQSLGYVLANLRSMVIKPAFRTSRRPTAFASQMSDERLAALTTEIKRTPHRYMAIAMPNFSTTPVFQNGKSCPWRMLMKCYTLQSGGKTEVLPGALVRLSPLDRELMFSAMSGSLTQDCWVQSEQTVEPSISLLPSKGTVPAITRFGDELPSRVAEQLYWLARYAERSESIARLLRTLLLRLDEGTELSDLPESRAMIRGLAALGQIEPMYGLEGMDRNMPEVDAAIVRSLIQPTKDDGLHRSLKAMLDAARTVRDRLPIDAYRILSRMVRMSESMRERPIEKKTSEVPSNVASTNVPPPNVTPPSVPSPNVPPPSQNSAGNLAASKRPRQADLGANPPDHRGVNATSGETSGGNGNDPRGPLQELAPDRSASLQPDRIGKLIEMLNRLIEDSLSFVGMMSENFVRSGAWPFLQLGCSIERAAQTSELLLATLVMDQTSGEAAPPDARAEIMEAVLETTDSLMTHRARYPGPIHLPTMLDLVVTDGTNPRSIAFQLRRIEDLLDDLSPPSQGDEIPADLRWVRELSKRLADTDLIRIAYPKGLDRPGVEMDDAGFKERQLILVDLMSGLNSDLVWLDRAIAGLHLLHTDVHVTGAGEISGDTVIRSDDLNDTPEPSWIDASEAATNDNMLDPVRR